MVRFRVNNHKLQLILCNKVQTTPKNQIGSLLKKPSLNYIIIYIKTDTELVYNIVLIYSCKNKLEQGHRQLISSQ